MNVRDSFWKAAPFVLRHAMLAVALITLALPTAAQDKVWRVGLLSTGSERLEGGVRQSWRSGVLLGLGNSGYHVGRNLELVSRYADGTVDRLPDLAQQIAVANVDVVIAVAEGPVRAMLQASRATPIVMVVGADPVAAGFVASLARPGGRVTGLSLQTFEGDVKRLELLHHAMPNARRLGYLRPPGPVPARAADLLLGAARQLDIELSTRSVDRLDKTAYQAAFAGMHAEGVVGVLVASTPILASDLHRFGSIAQGLGLPTICEWDFMARSGCTLAYGHDLEYAQRRSGEYAARILKGVPPADLPVEQSDAWKLTVNLSAAAAVNLVVPAAILARADEVIE